jgi:hypothetical protein
MVPLPQQPNTAVSYNLLQQLEAAGEREYRIEGSSGELLVISV